MQLQRLHRWSLMAFIMALVMLMLVLILMFNLHYSSIVMRIVLMSSHQLGTSLQQIIIYHCTICASCYWTCITIIKSSQQVVNLHLTVRYISEDYSIACWELNSTYKSCNNFYILICALFLTLSFVLWGLGCGS
jgi:hypothetical protein